MGLNRKQSGDNQTLLAECGMLDSAIVVVTPSSLSGEQIRIDFPRYNPSISTLFRLQRLSGEKHTTIQGPKDTAWLVPDREGTVSVAKEYLILGIEHILKGYDHLLFIACLYAS
jgi:hypothetical protein